MSKEVEAALVLLKTALRNEDQGYPVITTFMGMTPVQIQKIKNFWLEHHFGRLP